MPPLAVGRVESEVLAPPPGVETAMAEPVITAAKTSPQSVTPAAGFPPQPVAKNTLQPPGAKQQAAPPAQLQTASVVPPSIAPKVPPRMGSGKFMRPVDGKVISGYGPKDDGLHNDGINIKAPKGTAVRAADNGVVAYTGSGMSGYGNLVLIRHQDRWMTAYAHMDKILVKKGDVIKAGQSIGTVGATGQVDSSQLHFEVRKGTQAVDPVKYL
jgi:murein DD-endopeptidase MepM/ murein hydrolase activator NlpD